MLLLLPDTKHAVPTSVLSRRWLNLWTTLPLLLFDFDALAKNNDGNSFIRFLDNVISRNVSPTIHKFRLHYRNGKTSYDQLHTSVFCKSDWVQTPLPVLSHALITSKSLTLNLLIYVIS